MRKSELRDNNRNMYNNLYISSKKKQPFRLLDGKMLIGRHKGKYVVDVPKTYINWMVKELDLNKSSLSFLRRHDLI